MSESDQIAVVIPCQNEAASISWVVRKARELIPALYVVDDGSRDETAELAERCGAHVLRHSSPSGKGAALASGFRAASAAGFKWALAMDGDGQHDPADIPKFLSAAQSGSASMIIGNRMESADTMPWVRRTVNRWMSRQLGNFCGVELPDSQCGFRLVNMAAWKLLTFKTHNFEIESELIVRFIRAGFGLEFVPVQTRYGSETSKIRPLRDTMRWFRWWRGIQQEMSEQVPPGLENADRFAPAPQDAIA